jgi:hypothetical protein
MDLSNFLLIRTKEYLLLQNKVYAPQNVFKTGKHNKWTQNVYEKSLEAVRNDLKEGLQTLERILYVSTQMHDLPVAFASNALYVLERNG